MNKSLIICAILMITCSRSSFTEKTNTFQNPLFDNCDRMNSIPNIGDSYNIDKSKKGFLLVNSAQIYPSICIVVENVKFEIAVANEYKVIYIMTTDQKFKTPDNISTENTLEELINRFGDNLHAQPGYGWIFNLPSGWNACLVESNKSFGIIRPNNNKRISWISKSN
jgi:hypothetical protein